MIQSIRLCLVAFICLGLAACGRLPASGPASNELLNQAAVNSTDFALYSVTRAFLPTVSQWPDTGKAERLGWIGKTSGAKSQIIQSGDTLTVTIWDSSENSLLTTEEQRAVPLEGVRVAPDGTIFVPYIGDVSVVGLTPDLARREIQSQLEAIVPSAQVQLGMSEGRENSVELIGGVSAPGTYPMPDRNYSVLSLISAGGGVSNALDNPQIRLMRGNSIYGTSVERLLNNPGYDTLLRGGDKVFVENDARYFLSFGATGTEALYNFTKDDVSAMDAVSIMGGVNERTADPKGLLILREYPGSAVGPGVRGPRNTRVVFSVDLTTFDGLFSARNFAVNSGDVIVATESPINDVLTISQIFGQFFGVFNAANSL
ncbi:MAG: polysaccharide biosynthesis protein [Rhodobacteraceae bacterium]|nr:polysaccharide biosynthesis protein [Paracoccaceae bacterium]